MFWELEKAIFGPEKDKWWIRGSKTPKPPEMPIKLGKTSQHHNWPRHMDWPQFGPKIAIKQGKKRQKDKWYLIRAPTGGSKVQLWGSFLYVYVLFGDLIFRVGRCREEHSVDQCRSRLRSPTSRESKGNSNGILGNAGSLLSRFTGVYLVFWVSDKSGACFGFALLPKSAVAHYQILKCNPVKMALHCRSQFPPSIVRVY